MNKISVLIIIVLIIVLLVLVIQIDKLRMTISQKQKEIDLSLDHIEHLSKTMKNEEKNNSQRIRNILADYLEKPESADIQKNKFDLEKIKNSNWNERELGDFVPNKIPLKNDYSISQHFTENHTGLDFAAPLGDAVLAAGSGKIIAKYIDEYFGNILIIDHLNKYASVYAHLSEVFVEENELINKGDIIASIGNTGNSSAPHLHFEILIDGKSVNPEKLLK